MKKRVSIHDIAKQLKVSSATVSLVLNGKAGEHRISKESTERILAYAKEVNYHPNLVAKSLRTGKSRILGMLVEGISNPFFSTIASYLEHEAYQSGYKLFYSSTENNPAKAKDLIRAYRERQVEGYIIAPTSGIEAEIQSLMNEGLPVVVFDRPIPGLPATTVVVDNFKGSYDAVNHLLKNGYENIGLVTLESDQLQMQDREKGYMDALKKARSKPVVTRVSYSSENDWNVSAIRKFISDHPQVDAIVFATNYLALAGIEAIKLSKLNIADDIGIVAFDDNPFFNLFTPSITAVAQPLKEISGEIMNQLKMKLNSSGNESKNGTIVLKTKLVKRQSSIQNLKELSAG